MAHHDCARVRCTIARLEPVTLERLQLALDDAQLTAVHLADIEGIERLDMGCYVLGVHGMALLAANIHPELYVSDWPLALAMNTIAWQLAVVEALQASSQPLTLPQLYTALRVDTDTNSPTMLSLHRAIDLLVARRWVQHEENGRTLRFDEDDSSRSVEQNCSAPLIDSQRVDALGEEDARLTRLLPDTTTTTTTSTTEERGSSALAYRLRCVARVLLVMALHDDVPGLVPRTEHELHAMMHRHPRTCYDSGHEALFTQAWRRLLRPWLDRPTELCSLVSMWLSSHDLQTIRADVNEDRPWSHQYHPCEDDHKLFEDSRDSSCGGDDIDDYVIVGHDLDDLSMRAVDGCTSTEDASEVGEEQGESLWGEDDDRTTASVTDNGDLEASIKSAAKQDEQEEDKEEDEEEEDDEEELVVQELLGENTPTVMLLAMVVAAMSVVWCTIP